MTDFLTDEGERVEGVRVYARLRQGTWSVVAFDTDEDVRVVEESEGEVIVLREIPGTEEQAFGPHPYVPGKDGPT